MAKFFVTKQKFFYWIKAHPNLHYIIHVIRRFRDKDFYGFLFEDGYPGVIRLDNYGMLNSDKEIFLIDIQAEKIGLPCFIRYALSALYEIEQLNFVPYIHFTDISGWLQEDIPINQSMNVFEYYYEKIDKAVDMDNLKESFHVYSCNTKSLITRCNMDFRCHVENGLLAPYLVPDEYIREMGQTYSKYLKLNEQTIKYIDSELRTLFLEDDRVLGVHVRGTDFEVGYKNHPRILTIEQIIQTIDELLKKGKYTKLFIATDDENKLNMLSERYSDKILYFKDTFRSSEKKNILSIRDERNNSKYLKGLEVLRDIYALSRCKSLIAGLSHVSILARIIKSSLMDQYEYEVILSNGIN